jgi:RimJ/RimL family protein N-acetyltransferase
MDDQSKGGGEVRDAIEMNALGQVVGVPLGDWQAPPRPDDRVLEGRYCIIERLQATRHARPLYDANSQDREGRMWTYLPHGPFADFADYQAWVERAEASTDPWFYAIVDKERGYATGIASYLRITPEAGSIEVGALVFSPLLQRRAAATEAMALMMGHAFALGYRRYEWKCDALNRASRAAAERLGFHYEGTFRKAVVVKGRNRDTAWFSVTDDEWPALRGIFARWLDAANFDAEGRQRVALSALTRAWRAAL